MTSKKYTINHEINDENFQELLVSKSKNLLNSLNPFNSKTIRNEVLKEEFWALNDVNFEVTKGNIGYVYRVFCTLAAFYGK